MALTFPTDVVAAQDWRARAACRPGSGIDPEIFFPLTQSGPDGPPTTQEAAALAVCARCPVVAECLAFALTALPHGVAGGMTARQRDAQVRAGHAAGHVAPLVPDLERPIVGRSLRGAQLRARGIALLAAGTPRSDIRRELGVTARTIERWATSPAALAAGVGPVVREQAHPLTREQARRCGGRRVS